VREFAPALCKARFASPELPSHESHPLAGNSVLGCNRKAAASRRTPYDFALRDHTRRCSLSFVNVIRLRETEQRDAA
jgi:hypothetical protein